MTTIAVLVSGGVDSSVALAKLVEAGERDLTAYYLKIWLEDELAFLGSCPWQEDLGYVREACRLLGVSLEIVSLQREYWDRVVASSLVELGRGRTPSPDVLCNRLVKLGAFVDRIGPDVDRIATGHHARVDHEGGRSRLLRGADPVKDQTYFLSQLEQTQLARCLFPIGHLTKGEVRAEARRFGLPTCDRPDSQGICFLGRVPYDVFVEHHLGRRPGIIRDVATGRELGCHRGVWFHTIGQRRGLGLGGGPWYVIGKDLEHDELLVAHADVVDGYRRTRFTIASPHWIAGPPRRDRLELRVRHGQDPVGCRVAALDDDSLEVVMDEPDAGIAPGQYAVLYDGEECLGGGAIAG